MDEFDKVFEFGRKLENAIDSVQEKKKDLDDLVEETDPAYHGPPIDKWKKDFYRR